MRLTYLDTAYAGYSPKGEDKIVAAQDCREFIKSVGFQAWASRLARKMVDNQNTLEGIETVADAEQAIAAAAFMRAMKSVDMALVDVIHEGKETA